MGNGMRGTGKMEEMLYSGECPPKFQGMLPNIPRKFQEIQQWSDVPIRNYTTFGDKSVRVLGPQICNMLPAELKKET